MSLQDAKAKPLTKAYVRRGAAHTDGAILQHLRVRQGAVAVPRDLEIRVRALCKLPHSLHEAPAAGAALVADVERAVNGSGSSSVWWHARTNREGGRMLPFRGVVFDAPETDRLAEVIRGRERAAAAGQSHLRGLVVIVADSPLVDGVRTTDIDAVIERALDPILAQTPAPAVQVTSAVTLVRRVVHPAFRALVALRAGRAGEHIGLGPVAQAEARNDGQCLQKSHAF